MQTNSRHGENGRVGIVIPVFNRARVLLGSLESIEAQSVQPSHLIVVDDGSTDGSPDAAEEWLLARDPDFAWQVLRADHQGAAHARDLGFQALPGIEYVAFLDSDDRWPADFLARSTRLLDERPEAIAVSVDRLFRDATGTAKQQDCLAGLASHPIDWLFAHGGGIASCSLLRAKAVEIAGGWQPALESAEDFNLFVNISRGGEWLYSPGLPVEFDHGTAATLGEETNLSGRFRQGREAGIRVYERHYRDLGSRRIVVNRKLQKQMIALFWNRNAKTHLRAGKRGEALVSFARSIWWWPFQKRAWRQMIRTLAGKMGQRAET